MSMTRKARESLDRMIAIAKKQHNETSKRNIHKASPYSDTISDNIGSIRELAMYVSHGFREIYVYRPSLVMNVDPNYYDTCSKKTNLQRMMAGDPPFDTATGDVIELHHIGQSYDSPFVELPHSYHIGTGFNHVLHNNKAPSWRNDKEKEKQFAKDRKEHWKKRAEDYI